MLNATLRKNARNTLGVVDGNGTNQYWLTVLVALFNVSYDSFKLSVNSAIDQVIKVFTLNGTIRWNNLNRNVINLTELRVLSHCSTSHTRELVIHEEVILERNSCQSLILFTYLNVLFCLNCLVKTLRITAAFHNTTSKLVNNLDFTVNDNILLVTMEHVLSLQCLLQVIYQLTGLIVVDVVNVKSTLDLLETDLCCCDGVLCLVHLKVNIWS